MKALIQRVGKASVTVEGRLVSEIGRGLLLFLGVEQTDTPGVAESLARKVVGLRIFDDEEGKMNRSVEDVQGEYLIVSQFTLCADLRKGKRPGFEAAMRPPTSLELYETFCAQVAALSGRPVRKGEFGASMVVDIRNEGPATFLLEMH